MADDMWHEDPTMPDASDYNPGLDWQSFLLTCANGASSDVDFTAHPQWTGISQESLGEMEYEREANVPYMEVASNGEGTSLLDPGEVTAPLFADSSLQAFDHQQMGSGADEGPFASEYRPPLPTFSINTPSDGQQDVVGRETENRSYDTTYRQVGYDTGAVSNRYAAGDADSVQHPLESHQQAHCFDSNMRNQRGGTTPHSPPWNPLALRGAQNTAAFRPICNCSGSASRVPTATDCWCSNPSYTGTPTTMSGSAYLEMADSSSTAQDALPSSASNRLPQRQLSGSSGNPSTGYDTRRGLSASGLHARSRLQNPKVGESSRSRLSVSGHTETNSHASSSAISPASIAPSHESGTLRCPHDNCQAGFSGPYGRGSCMRHIRLKHKVSQNHVYSCEVDGCEKKYQRSDARLNHYRKHHAGVVPSGAPKSRKRHYSAE